MLQTGSVTSTERRGRPRKYAEGEVVSKPTFRLNAEQAAKFTALSMVEGLSDQDLFIKLIEDACAEHPDRELIRRHVVRKLAGAPTQAEPPKKPRKQ